MSKHNRIIFLFVFIFFVPFIFCQDISSASPEYILTEMNNAYRSGVSVNFGIVSACIQALMEQGDGSAYPVLFSVLTSGYPEIIISEAAGAMDEINGDLYSFLLEVMQNNPPAEKFIAFKTAVNSQRLSVSERGFFAELALQLSFYNSGDDPDLTALRYNSVTALTELKWKRSNAMVIGHYYRTQADYMQGLIEKDRFIEAIACLGAVGDSDAAFILVLQLGLINVRMERTGDFDPEITLAIVQALGNIGDSAAFDHLLFASNLPFNEEITAAAQEAIAYLKWQ